MSYIHPHWHLAKPHQLSPFMLQPAKSLQILLNLVATCFGALPDHHQDTTIDELQTLSQQIPKPLQEPVIACPKQRPHQKNGSTRRKLPGFEYVETKKKTKKRLCRACGEAWHRSDSTKCKNKIELEFILCILGRRSRNIVTLSMNHVGLHKLVNQICFVCGTSESCVEIVKTIDESHKVVNHANLHKLANKRCFVCCNSHTLD